MANPSDRMIGSASTVFGGRSPEKTARQRLLVNDHNPHWVRDEYTAFLDISLMPGWDVRL